MNGPHGCINRVSIEKASKVPPGLLYEAAVSLIRC